MLDTAASAEFIGEWGTSNENICGDHNVYVNAVSNSVPQGFLGGYLRTASKCQAETTSSTRSLRLMS